MTKLIVVVGITGNQGASVADVFVKDPAWKVRGITRDPSKSAGKALTERGIELVKGNLDDKDSLVAAFKGANAIYSVTDFWGPFSNPANKSKLKPGQTINEYCYDYELQQGKNIADAAATTVDTLDHIIVSALSNTKKWSKGKYTWVYHFDGKAATVDYIKEKHPALAEKMSVLQVGLYASNWKGGGLGAPHKQSDGSYLLTLPCNGDKPIPMAVPERDNGNCVKALVEVPPGKNLLQYGSLISWKEYMKLWAKLVNVPAGNYKELTVADVDAMIPGGLGRELAEMFAYMGEFGYDGGDPTIVHPKDLGVPCHTTSMEEYIKSEDFSSILE